jgi:hypothetical protein
MSGELDLEAFRAAIRAAQKRLAVQMSLHRRDVEQIKTAHENIVKRSMALLQSSESLVR